MLCYQIKKYQVNHDYIKPGMPSSNRVTQGSFTPTSSQNRA